MVDANGVSRGSAYYKSFGETRSSSIGGITDNLYTGQKFDTSINMYWYGSRMYDQSLGRYISPDSIVPDPLNPQALNRYSYVLNSPMRYIDPTGHYSEDELNEYLGEDWKEVYFGKGGVFEGRTGLYDMLISPDTKDLNNLMMISTMFRGARIVRDKTGGVISSDVDAIGYRGTISGGLIAYAEGDVTVVLNLTSGELSYFVAPAAGVVGGGGAYGSAGLFFLKGMPKNLGARGFFYSYGAFAAAPLYKGLGPGVYAEFVYGVGDPTTGQPIPNGGGAGGLIGAGAGFYLNGSVSLEVQRMDATGNRWLPDTPVEPLLKWLALRVPGETQ